jgi:5-methylthioadenosine/S-adenosylhomocysteine deaminase
MTTDIDLVLHARWVIPVEPETAVYPDHAVAVHAGRIVEVLPSTRATERYRAREVARLARHALIPGLVNAHTHAAMVLFRGLADDLALMDWLEHHIWPAERRFVGPEFVRDGMRHAVAEMIAGGTTCCNDMFFFPGEGAAVAAEAGLRITAGLIVIEFPTPWARDTDEYFSKAAAVYDTYRDHPLVRLAFAPHAPYTVSDDALLRVSALAEELDIPIQMHVHETEGEVREALAACGERPLARLRRLGLLSPRLQAVHMTALDAQDIALIAEHGVQVIHCPSSNLKLASGFCPVHALQAAGVNVALGTDGAASNNRLDLLTEMRTAALLAKAVAGEARAVPAARALYMATLAGARAMGIDDLTGSLAPGKAADLVAIDLGGIEAEPVYDPISQIVYAAGRECVTDVWVGGEGLYRERRLKTLDGEAILARSHAWRARIAAEFGDGQA